MFSSILFGFSEATKDIPSMGNKVKESLELGEERNERGVGVSICGVMKINKWGSKVSYILELNMLPMN